MAIFRNVRKNNFTTIANEALNNPELSFKAKGILTYLIGKNKDWEVRLQDLVTKSTDGSDSVKSGLKELRDKGYLKTFPKRDNKGVIVDNVTFVSDNPEDIKQVKSIDYQIPTGGKPVGRETLLTENPADGKSTPINKEYNKERVNKERIIAPNSKDFEIAEVLANFDIHLTEEELITPVFFLDVEISRPEIMQEIIGAVGDIDINYYIEAVIDWTATKTPTKNGTMPKKVIRKRSGWVATLKNFIRADEKNNKLRRLSKPTTDLLNLGR